MPEDVLAVPIRIGIAIVDGAYELPVYPFVAPAELRGVPLRHPVAIVGGGVVGLTAACDLALRGIPAVLLDEDDTVGVRGASSRGICYAQKSLEIFRRLGIFDRMLAKGVQWSVGRTLAGDDEIYRFDLRSQSTHDASEQPAFINLQQFYVEWFLVDRIQELSVVDLRWKNRVVGIEPHADHVTLHVDTPGGAYRLEANWVIDASGAHTLVREQLGVGMTVSKAIDRWCISDVRFERPAPAERWTWIEAHSNENRAVWRHPMADDVWRLDYQMPPDADPNAVSAREVVEERIRRQFGDDVEFEIVWVGPYAYRSACADAFRIGRVFLAGDAAHVMSPFGARGGNSGIQDADNLVWKLALVLENKAPEGLLDSYASERRFAAQENIRITNRTTRFLSPRSPTERVLREAVIALAREVPFARGFVNTGRLSSPTRYADSPLNVGAAGHSRAGRHVQNVALTLPDGTRGDLVELLLRYDHAVLVFFAFDVARDLAREVARIEEAFPARCLVLRAEANETSRLPVVVDSEHKLAAQLGVTLGEGAAAAIVWPDLHLAGTVEIKTAGDLEAALQIVLGGREPPRPRRRR